MSNACSARAVAGTRHTNTAAHSVFFEVLAIPFPEGSDVCEHGRGTPIKII